MKALILFFLKLFYRYEAFGTESLNTKGPVLLIPNHASWLDWLFLGVLLDDDWKFVTSSTTAQASWLHRVMMINSRTFPIDTSSPYAVKRMAEYLQTNGRLVLFAEGRLSRTGSLMKLFDGTGFLLFKTGAQVITCYLRGIHRLPLSPNKDEKLLFPTITAHFSKALKPPHFDHSSTTETRHELTAWLKRLMIDQRFEVELEQTPPNLYTAIYRQARPFLFRTIIEDAFEKKISYLKLFAGAEILVDRLKPSIPVSQQRVAVLMPNVASFPVLLMALWRLERVPAILNYSTGGTIMLSCLKIANIQTVITSRGFLEKARLDLHLLSEAGIQFVYMEDIGANIGGQERTLKAIAVLLGAVEMPRTQMNDTAVILFTSGSEGVPKGVELTHRNLYANTQQILAITDLQDNDKIFNALPLFHSFGLSIGTVLPLLRGMCTFIYPSPLHYRVIPNAFYDRDCTVMLGTNTFLNGYARKANSYDFRSLRYMFAGAEKIQEATANLWSRTFGVRILEGYGATECGPCVSLNTPLMCKYGTAGNLLPGMEYKIVPIEGVERGGRLFVKGPNVMKGYVNPDANAGFLALGGWYDTGDIVEVDSQHFVHILGRLKRFAKISGEMVSLSAVEDALAGAFPQFGLRTQVAVVALPCEDKGEALIAVSNEEKLTLGDLREAIRQKGLPNLCTPRELVFLREIPKLGTGKTNHKELEKWLKEKRAANVVPG
ncbi:MAG: aas [Verrucomicrobiales bacterium]|nr:aas [Verrucomicrobiales bacterium]